jgi:hypothetical protein
MNFIERIEISRAFGWKQQISWFSKKTDRNQAAFLMFGGRGETSAGFVVLSPFAKWTGLLFQNSIGFEVSEPARWSDSAIAKHVVINLDCRASDGFWTEAPRGSLALLESQPVPSTVN